MDYKIEDLIPQRRPFLFVDKVLDHTSNSIVTELTLTGKENFFKGHFPGNPIMPGVLLQEALFQSGAAMITLIQKNSAQNLESRIGVVARVKNAKFKNFVKPGDTLKMSVELTETLDNAFYMKGISKVDGKSVLSLEFTCALV